MVIVGISVPEGMLAFFVPRRRVLTQNSDHYLKDLGTLELLQTPRHHPRDCMRGMLRVYRTSPA